MKRELLAVLATAVVVAGVAVGAVALSNTLEGSDPAPTVRDSSEQTIVPTPAQRAGYPVSRWRELQAAKETAR